MRLSLLCLEISCTQNHGFNNARKCFRYSKALFFQGKAKMKIRNHFFFSVSDSFFSVKNYRPDLVFVWVDQFHVFWNDEIWSFLEVDPLKFTRVGRSCTARFLWFLFIMMSTIGVRFLAVACFIHTEFYFLFFFLVFFVQFLSGVCFHWKMLEQTKSLLICKR